MTETLQDKRQHARKRLTTTAHVYHARDGVAVGQLFDISKEGFMLLCEQRVKPEITLDLSLELPELDSTRTIALQAECIWCQPSSFCRSFGAGFHIKRITDQDQVALNYFIRDF